MSTEITRVTTELQLIACRPHAVHNRHMPGPLLIAFQYDTQPVAVLGQDLFSSLWRDATTAILTPLSCYAPISIWTWLLTYSQTPCLSTLTWVEESVFSQLSQRISQSKQGEDPQSNCERITSQAFSVCNKSGSRMVVTQTTGYRLFVLIPCTSTLFHIRSS